MIEPPVRFSLDHDNVENHQPKIAREKIKVFGAHNIFKSHSGKKLFSCDTSSGT